MLDNVVLGSVVLGSVMLGNVVLVVFVFVLHNFVFVCVALGSFVCICLEDCIFDKYKENMTIHEHVEIDYYCFRKHLFYAYLKMDS